MRSSLILLLEILDGNFVIPNPTQLLNISSVSAQDTQSHACFRLLLNLHNFIGEPSRLWKPKQGILKTYRSSLDKNPTGGLFSFAMLTAISQRGLTN